MTNTSDDAVLSHTNLEEVIMDVAGISAPEESANRVAQRALDETSGGPVSLPTTAGRSRRMFVAVGASVLALGAVVPFTTNFFAANVVFAQVQQELKSTQSLQYVEYLTEAGAQRELEEAENNLEMIQFEVKAMGERGQEVDSERAEKQIARLRKYIQELKAKIENSEPIEQRRVWIQGRYLHRVEQSAMAPGISVTNAETGVSVSLDPERKSCTLLKTQTVINMKSGEKTVTPLGPNPATNFYAAMTQIPPGEVLEVGRKQLDGKQAVGFQQTDDLDDCVVTRTYWIDTKTKLPIRIEAAVKRDGVEIRGTTIRDMVFNQKVDPEMFSTTPPEGYSVREGGFMSLDPGTAVD